MNNERYRLQIREGKDRIVCVKDKNKREINFCYITSTQTFYEELSKGCQWNTRVVIVECAHNTLVISRRSLGEVESVRVACSHWVIEYGGTISIHNDSSVFIPPNCSGRPGGSDASYTCWRFSISRIQYRLRSNSNCEQMNSSYLCVNGSGWRVSHCFMFVTCKAYCIIISLQASLM